MGFPTRISQSALGPAKINTHEPRDPTKVISAAEWNLMRWTLGGAAGTVAQAWVLATFTGPSTITKTAHREAWDPDAALVGPTLARTGTGVYTVTYDATYLDETGTAVAIQLLGAHVSPRATTNLNAVWEIASNRIVTVSIFTANSAAPTDASFHLSVY